MAFDTEFQESVQELLVPFMGTENVGNLLYSLVRMTRSWRVLEVGLGYTTPFLARALVDTARDFVTDIETCGRPDGDRERRGLLSPDYYMQSYSAVLHAIDDYSIEGSSAPRVLEVLKKLKLDDVVEVHNGDFRGMSKEMPPGAFPLDLVWFDCGDLEEYVDFLEEYWPLIKPDGGMLLLHFTHWTVQTTQGGTARSTVVPGSIVNEIKRQHAKAGLSARFEVLSLVEPHKTRQGSVTMIRRLGPDFATRDIDFQDDVKNMLGRDAGPMRDL